MPFYIRHYFKWEKHNFSRRYIKALTNVPFKILRQRQPIYESPVPAPQDLEGFVINGDQDSPPLLSATLRQKDKLRDLNFRSVYFRKFLLKISSTYINV